MKKTIGENFHFDKNTNFYRYTSLINLSSRSSSIPVLSVFKTLNKVFKYFIFYLSSSLIAWTLLEKCHLLIWVRNSQLILFILAFVQFSINNKIIIKLTAFHLYNNLFVYDLIGSISNPLTYVFVRPVRELCWC